MTDQTIFQQVVSVIKQGVIVDSSKNPCEVLSEKFPSIKPNAFFAYFASLCFDLECSPGASLNSKLIVLQDDRYLVRPLKAVVFYRSTPFRLGQEKMFDIVQESNIDKSDVLVINANISVEEYITNPVYIVRDVTIWSLVRFIMNDDYAVSSKVSTDSMSLQRYIQMLSYGILHHPLKLLFPRLDCTGRTDHASVNMLDAYINLATAHDFQGYIVTRLYKLEREIAEAKKQLDKAHNDAISWYTSLRNSIDGIFATYGNNLKQAVVPYINMFDDAPSNHFVLLKAYNDAVEEYARVHARFFEDVQRYEETYSNNEAWYSKRILHENIPGHEDLVSAVNNNNEALTCRGNADEDIDSYDSAFII